MRILFSTHFLFHGTFSQPLSLERYFDTETDTLRILTSTHLVPQYPCMHPSLSVTTPSQVRNAVLEVPPSRLPYLPTPFHQCNSRSVSFHQLVQQYETEPEQQLEIKTPPYFRELIDTYLSYPCLSRSSKRIARRINDHFTPHPITAKKTEVWIIPRAKHTE